MTKCVNKYPSVLEVSRHLINAITALMRVTEKFRKVQYTYRKKVLKILIKRSSLKNLVRTSSDKIKKGL